MTENNRLQNVEATLAKHGEILSDIRETLSKIAVQDERISTIETTMEKQYSTLWQKYDALVDPKDGTITHMAQWQASCPRPQIKFLWWFVASFDTLLLVLLGTFMLMK